jgi:predicted AlkP superfamily phosphohydrolase/phosphomutase
MKSDPLWKTLSDEGKRVVVINVPVTYPPRAVNGILISGFLAVEIEKATYPKEVADVLHEVGYRIDVDPWKAREGKIDEFLEDLETTLQKRFEAAFRYMDGEPWDFFQLHVMGTDRINHFLWNSDTYSEEFLRYYRRIDHYLGELERRIDHDTTLIILSDHGFCSIEKEIDLNVWLRQNGYLTWRDAEPGRLADIGSHSSAYSLPPGRIYVKDEKVREEIECGLMEWRDSETGSKIVERVFKRHELYQGEMVNAGPDLVAHPYNGFDLKASFKKKDSVSTRTPLVGMHTYDDAFIYIRGKHIEKENPAIIDVMPTILALLKVDPPGNIDGSNCI